VDAEMEERSMMPRLHLGEGVFVLVDKEAREITIEKGSVQIRLTLTMLNRMRAYLQTLKVDLRRSA
jgi:hypothetical protein